jgi:hypothetical protein
MAGRSSSLKKSERGIIAPALKDGATPLLPHPPQSALPCAIRDMQFGTANDSAGECRGINYLLLTQKQKLGYF